MKRSVYRNFNALGYIDRRLGWSDSNSIIAICSRTCHGDGYAILYIYGCLTPSRIEGFAVSTYQCKISFISKALA
jgi:hypothetical protein